MIVPQLQHDPCHLPEAILKDKRQLLTAPHLTVIAPSKKMAMFARQSVLFQDTRIETIHNSIDTTSFRPMAKQVAKHHFDIPSDAKVIAFGSENNQQRSKGMAELILVIRQCQQHLQFRNMLNAKQLFFLCCGPVNPDILALELPLLNVGLIRSDETLRHFYAAADVFVQPSLEESFGNMAIESLCCGTPVIGFDVGVAPEAIAPDTMGRIVPLGDIQAMTDAVLDFAFQPDKWQAMGEVCHRRATQQFSQKNQAQQVLALYRDLLGEETIASTPQQDQNVQRDDCEHEVRLPWDCRLGPATQSIAKAIALSCLSKELLQVQATLDHREGRLKVLRDRIQTLRQHLDARNSEVQALNQELSLRNEELDAMKTSKFWKLRMLWMKVRSGLGTFTQ